jgi:hypothetical protein
MIENLYQAFSRMQHRANLPFVIRLKSIFCASTHISNTLQSPSYKQIKPLAIYYSLLELVLPR